MSELFEQFLVEARELVETAGAGLLRLERDLGDTAPVHEVFRAFHTLKGSTALFGWPAFTRLVHVAEDALAAVRAGRRRPTAELVDGLLAVLDQCGRWIDAVERDGALPADAADHTRRLETLLRGLDPATDGAGNAEPAAGPAAGFEWLARLTALERRGAVTALAYEPDPNCFFNGDDPLALVRRIPGLSWLRIEPTGPWPAELAALDPYRCALRFRALSTAPAGDIAPLFRAAPDQIRFAPLPQAREAAAGGAPSPDARALAEAMLREQLRILAIDAAANERDGRLAAVGRCAANVLTALGRAAEVAAVEAATATARAAGHPAALADLVARLLAGDSATTDGPAADTAADTAAETGGAAGPATAPAADGAAARRALRVDPERIDQLLALVGELVVAKNRLPVAQRAVEGLDGGRRPARLVKEAHDAIDGLADALQRAVLRLRMLPLAQVFQPLPRLVRDLAQRFGKRVELTLAGEGTEADKDVLAALGEPLLHLVRNAVDHGIETPAARRAAGKPETATIRVTARQERDGIIVEVADDGAGIDAARLRRKAVESGAAPAARVEAMDDAEALSLIFLPGLSTALAVTDVSGRGVGMDAVRTAVAAVGGRVEVASTPGAGTRVRLTLPLTLVITPIMVVTAGGAPFGVPTAAVAEVARLPASAVRRVKHAESFALRGAVVPLFRLDRLLDLPGAGAGSGGGEVTVLVLRLGGEPVGVAVDAVRERAQVVLKPLSGVLAGLRGYAGTAELGDGRLLPVVNLGELL